MSKRFQPSVYGYFPRGVPLTLNARGAIYRVWNDTVELDDDDESHIDLDPATLRANTVLVLVAS